MAIGLAILLAAQLIGEVIVRLAGVPVPGPVVGMVLVVVGLEFWPGLREAIEPTATTLLTVLTLLFVPAGVGVVGHLDMPALELMGILVALVGSTVAAIVVAARVFGWLAGESDVRAG